MYIYIYIFIYFLTHRIQPFSSFQTRILFCFCSLFFLYNFSINFLLGSTKVNNVHANKTNDTFPSYFLCSQQSWIRRVHACVSCLFEIFLRSFLSSSFPPLLFITPSGKYTFTPGKAVPEHRECHARKKGILRMLQEEKTDSFIEPIALTLSLHY